MSGCEIEFNGFITAADNLFIEEENAIEHANTLSPIGTIEQKSFTCPNDVTVQYTYYEVSSEPEVTELCRDNFTAFLASNTSFLGQNFRTQAEAEQRVLEILTQFPEGFARVRSLGFACENGTFIFYWFVESFI